MTDPPRPTADTVKTAKTARLLTAFLDDQRTSLISKVAGVGDEAARKPMVPSGTSLAGILKHMAYVERFWFQEVFEGREVEFPWTEDDPDADWRVDDWETVEGLTEFYEAEIEAARRIVAAARSMKQRAAHPDFGMTLRWIMAHMIEETARHAGHADILREQIDGVTGL